MRWLLVFLLFSLPAQARDLSEIYVVRHQSWSDDDERGWRDFISAIGASDCRTLDACLHGSANPFAGSDRPGFVFQSDCADLPYVLRFYYAWKRGLPFSFVSDVRARGATRDIRYSPGGNDVAARFDVPSGTMSGYEIIGRIRDAISSASYRLHPDMENGDFYSPRLDPASIRPGTIVYDPAGHVGLVYRVEANGRIHFFDAHTDFSLTETVYDLRFARDRPAIGAGLQELAAADAHGRSHPAGAQTGTSRISRKNNSTATKSGRRIRIGKAARSCWAARRSTITTICAPGWPAANCCSSRWRN